MQLGLIQNSSPHCYSSSVYIRTWLFIFQAFHWATRSWKTIDTPL